MEFAITAETGISQKLGMTPGGRKAPGVLLFQGTRGLKTVFTR
jgi:hypothetical protein